MVMNNMNKHFILLLSALFTLPLIAQNSGGFERRVLIEEGTGTRCPNCPRGFVGIQELKEAYGDRAVVIAVHQFDNRDPMYLRHSNYPDCNFAGFPIVYSTEMVTTTIPYMDGIWALALYWMWHQATSKVQRLLLISKPTPRGMPTAVPLWAMPR